MQDTINVKGLSDLAKFMDALAPKVQTNIMRAALRQGANVFRDEAKTQLASNGNVKTGLLQKGLKVSTRSKGGIVTASLRAKGKHGYIAHWIEFGVAAHRIAAKNGKALSFGGKDFKYVEHPGFAPKPFMRPALDSKAGEATVAVGEAIKAKLEANGLDVADIDIGEV